MQRDEARRQAPRAPRGRGPARLGRAPVGALLATVFALQLGAELAGREQRAAVATLPPVTVSAPAPEPRYGERQLQEQVERYREQGFRVPSALAAAIRDAAAENDVPLDVAFGLVRAESSFRNTATSVVGAVGLTQLMPKTAAWLEPGTSRAELRDPETNLRIGFKYLRRLLDQYDGDARLALTAYNRGPGTVDRELKRGGNPDNGYADFVYGKQDHGHRLFTRRR